MKEIPWDLEQLQTEPSIEWLDRREPVHTLLYQGEPFSDIDATQVFAYYATPGTLNSEPKLDQNLPAAVLVHGGGGTAFDQWVEKWARAGYAAIAMDLKGGKPDGSRLADGGPKMDHPNIFHTISAEKTKHWCYHAVANVICAHSLIRSFPEVDADRTAITGISWGGFLTSIVSGLDHRFKASVPVYGCGYIYKNGPWLAEFEAMSDSDRQRWIELYDPSQYLGSCQTPTFFVNGTNDFAYLPDIYEQSYQLVKGERNFQITVEMGHGHHQGWAPAEIELFLAQNLRDGAPLPTIEKPTVYQGQLRAQISTVTELRSANLHFTTDKEPYPNCKWETVSAEIIGQHITAGVPSTVCCIFLFTVEDERGAVVSSPFLFN